MFRIAKRDKQQPEEPAPDYKQWEQDVLLGVFTICMHHDNRRSYRVIVDPDDPEHPRALCKPCYIAYAA
jgi:hypothetical protein